MGTKLVLTVLATLFVVGAVVGCDSGTVQEPTVQEQTGKEGGGSTRNTDFKSD